jgi:putative hydrolase of the HAD superfamily
LERRWWKAIVRESLRLADAAPEESQFQACFEDIFTYYGTVEPWYVYPDTLKVLPRLRADYNLVVLSNFDGRLLKVMDALELTPLVHHILYSSSLGACKPSPEAFDRALKAANAKRGQTLHIGDDPDTDAKGAAAAGLQFFHLKRPETDLHALEKHLAQAR